MPRLCPLLMLSLALAPVRPSAGESPANPVAAYNYILGVQTIHPSYQFTKQTRLVETAEAIQALGATVIKFEMSRSYPRDLAAKAEANPKIHTLTELARDEPSFHRVLDMPFSRFVLWTHSFACDVHFRDGFPKPPGAGVSRNLRLHALSAENLRRQRQDILPRPLGRRRLAPPQRQGARTTSGRRPRPFRA